MDARDAEPRELFPVAPPVEDGPPLDGWSRFERAIEAMWWGLRLSFCAAVAMAPLVVALGLLRPSPDIAWVFAVAALSAGPALSAALYAVREHYSAPDRGVVGSFWHGWRLNAGAALAIVAPVGLVIGVALPLLGTESAEASVVVARGAAVGVCAIASVGVVHALALVSFFHVSWWSVARLGGFYLVAAWRSTLALLVMAALVMAAGLLLTVFACAVLLGPLVWLWYRAEVPMLRNAAERFFPPGGAEPSMASQPHP